MSPPANGTSQDPVVVVTGGANGIGAAIVRRFHAAGACVVIADVDEAAAQKTAAQLGERAVAMHCDVTQEESVAKVVDDTVARFGTLNTFVNNAGICFHNHTQDLFETSMEDFDRTQAVNFRGVFLGLKHASRAMVAAKPLNPSIVNIASVCGIRGSGKECVSYQAAKAGVIGLTLSGAAKLVFHGIRVNAVSPSVTVTPMVEKAMSLMPPDPMQTAFAMALLLPLHQTPMDPKEIADTVHFLASDAARSITGVNIPVDQGWSCGAIGEVRPPEAPQQ